MSEIDADQCHFVMPFTTQSDLSEASRHHFRQSLHGRSVQNAYCDRRIPQVAPYDSSYNQHQDGLYNEMNSWVVVRTM